MDLHFDQTMAAQIAELLSHPDRSNAQNALNLADTLRASAKEVENPEPVEITQALVDLHHMLAGLGLNCLHARYLSMALSKCKRNNLQNRLFLIPATRSALSNRLKVASDRVCLVTFKRATPPSEFRKRMVGKFPNLSTR